MTAYIAILTYRKRSDTAITKSDWAFLIVALAALVLHVQSTLGRRDSYRARSGGIWSDIPLSYLRPYGERMGFYSLAAARSPLAILALEHYSLTTVSFPAAVGLACLAFVAMVAYRRKQLAGQLPA
jgi:hypothetical protein